jgi:calcineurin-like phosphoesterase family protein
MIWFTSDQHFGHKNIIRYSGRPFSDVAEMDHEIVARHNAVVHDGDEVWHLGDVALDERRLKDVMPVLKGTHHLVSGNHDKCHPCHRGARSRQAQIPDLVCQRPGPARMRALSTLSPAVRRRLRARAEVPRMASEG